jgi:hypothetical protein
MTIIFLRLLVLLSGPLAAAELHLAFSMLLASQVMPQHKVV